VTVRTAGEHGAASSLSGVGAAAGGEMAPAAPRSEQKKKKPWRLDNRLSNLVSCFKDRDWRQLSFMLTLDGLHRTTLQVLIEMVTYGKGQGFTAAKAFSGTEEVQDMWNGLKKNERNALGS
jgi:hypothetical protein